MERKVALIGIDGVPFDLIKQWVNAGYMPTLASFFENGVGQALYSTVPPISPTAWATIATGVDPYVHNIWAFRLSHGKWGRREIVNAATLKQPTIWQLLTSAGHRCVVADYPLSWPAWASADNLQCCNVVSGWIGAPLKGGAEHAYNPLHLRKELEHSGFAWEPHNPLRAQAREQDLETYLKAAHAFLKRKLKLFTTLAMDYNPVLMVAVFVDTDRILHFGMELLERDPYHEGVLKYFQELDQAIGRLMRLLPDRDFFIVSDHGMQVCKSTWDLNVWLLKNGFIKPKSNPLSFARFLLWRLGWTPGLVRSLLLSLRQGAIKQQVAENHSLRDLLRHFFFSYRDIDAAKSSLVGEGEEVGLVYGKLFFTEKMRLTSLLEPEKAVVAVDFKEEAQAFQPSCVIWPNEGVSIKGDEEFSSSSVYGSPHEPGMHSMHGMLLAQGPHIKKCSPERTPELVDIAPTILAALGLSADWMESQPLPIFVKNEKLMKIDYKSSNSSNGVAYTSQEEQEVARRLQELGYEE